MLRERSERANDNRDARRATSGSARATSLRTKFTFDPCEGLNVKLVY
jgi:hypothetical protein